MTPYSFKAIQRKRKTAQHRVALLANMPTGARDEILYGFQRYNDLSDRYVNIFPYFSLGSDPLRIELTIREILEEQYDLIFCIGGFSASILHRLTATMKNPPPVVFCMTSDPVRLGIINSLESSGNNMVGVEEVLPFLTPVIPAFLKIQPYPQRILLPYDEKLSTQHGAHTTHRMKNEHIEELCSALTQAGHTVDALPTRTPEEGVPLIAKQLIHYDLLLVLSSTNLIGMHGVLGHYCDTTKTVMCANLRSAVRCSAAFGYAASFSRLGVEAAKLAHQILFDHIHPSDIPTRRLSNERTLMVNREIAATQGANVEQLITHAGDGALIFEKRASFPPRHTEDNNLHPELV